MRPSPRNLLVIFAAVCLAGCSEPTASILEAPAPPARTAYTAAAGAPTLLEAYNSSTYIIAYGVNDQGTISGVSGTPSKAVIWQTGAGVTAASTAPQVVHSDGGAGRDINSAGQVAGSIGAHAALWTPSGDGYVVTPIGSAIAGAFLSDAFGINAQGQVVGTYRILVDGFAHDKCFVWTPSTPNATTGTTTEVPSLGGSFCVANDINASSQIAGASTHADGTSAAFVFHAGTTIDLQPSSTWSYATSINDAGQVAGMTYNGVSQPAAIWSPLGSGSWSPATEIGAPALSGQSGSVEAWALDINDAGFVVGFTRDQSFTTRAFFWQGGEFTELVGVSSGTVQANAMTNMTSNVVVVAGGASDAGVRYGMRWAVQLTPVVTAGCLSQLVQLVTDLRTAGTLKEGEARSLLAKLDAAARQSREGKLTPARNLLLAFISEVEALAASRRLTAAQSTPLTDNASCAMAEL